MANGWPSPTWRSSVEPSLLQYLSVRLHTHLDGGGHFTSLPFLPPQSYPWSSSSCRRPPFDVLVISIRTLPEKRVSSANLSCDVDQNMNCLPTELVETVIAPAQALMVHWTKSLPMWISQRLGIRRSYRRKSAMHAVCSPSTAAKQTRTSSNFSSALSRFSSTQPSCGLVSSRVL